jgi:AraC-like DNA-binding protein
VWLCRVNPMQRKISARRLCFGEDVTRMPSVATRSMDGAGLSYREFLPSPALAAPIEYLWTLQADGVLAFPVHQISAGKSGVDLILSLDGYFCAHAEEHLFGRPGAGSYLVGPLSEPRTIVTTGRCLAVGARFRPGHAQGFFRLAMHELTDRCLDVASISATAERGLSGVVHDARNEWRRVEALQNALCALRSNRSEEQSGSAALAAIRLIDERSGAVDVETLAHALGSSVRHLERRFRATIGQSPKLACRIARIRHAMSLLPLRNGQSWSDVVYACGFYDQAHFIREFRAIAGVTPSRFAHGCCDKPDMKVGFVQYGASAQG